MNSKGVSEAETLVEAALRVLNTPDPVEKAQLGESVATSWLKGVITCPFNTSSSSSADLIVPDRPARLTNVLVSPSFVYMHYVLVMCLMKCLNECR